VNEIIQQLVVSVLLTSNLINTSPLLQQILSEINSIFPVQKMDPMHTDLSQNQLVQKMMGW
jgi:hypothetical protein